LLYLFEHIHRYHSRVEEQTEDCGPLDVSNLLDPIIVLPLKRLDRIARKALRLALSLTSEIHVIQVLSEDLRTDDLARRWPELVEQPVRRLNRPSPVLIVRPSAYRDFFGPLLDYVREVSQKHPHRHIAILVPEFVERRWYHFVFRHRATLLKILLMLRGGPQVVIITAPWYERSALKEQPFA
jgi:hypothetical protein